MSDTPAPLFPDRDSDAVIEFVARAVFPELEGATSDEVARRADDVRDVLDGLPVATLSQLQRDRIGTAAAVFRLPR